MLGYNKRLKALEASVEEVRLGIGGVRVDLQRLARKLEGWIVSVTDQITQEMQQISALAEGLPTLLGEVQSCAQLAQTAHDDLAALRQQVTTLQGQIGGDTPDLSAVVAQLDQVRQNLSPLADMKPQLDQAVASLTPDSSPAPPSSS